MSSLYEISDRLLSLYAVMDDEGFSEECIKDTLEALEGEFDDKVEGWCKWIKSIESDVKTAKEEADRLREKAKRDEKKILQLKSTLAEYMNAVERPKVKTALFNVNRLKMNGKLDIDGMGDIPDEYKKKVVKEVTEVDKEKIKEELDKGWDLPFARYYNSITIS